MSVFLSQPVINPRVSASISFFCIKYPSLTQFFIVFASCLSPIESGQVNILGAEPAQKETSISPPATNYWDSPCTEAIQGEALANINTLGLCQQTEGPETTSSAEQLLPCDKRHYKILKRPRPQMLRASKKDQVMQKHYFVLANCFLYLGFRG